MQVPSTDSLELTVHDLGGAGPPALLAHATGFHGRVWAPFAHQLHGLRAWAPDLRGHGDSITPPGHRFAWESFADDVLACVEGLGFNDGPGPRPVGVGHSKGGAALLLAEQRRPGTFRALWCFEPVVFPPGTASAGEGPNVLAQGALNRRDRFGSFSAATENYSGKPPMNRFDPDALREYVQHGFAAEADGPVVLKCRPADESRIYTMGSSHRAFDHLGEVHCPVLVVRGAIDSPGPAAMAPDVAAALPAGSLEVHDELGHFGPLEDPTGMAASFMAFLDRVEGS